MPDIIYTRRPEYWRHGGQRGSMVTHGIRVIHPYNTSKDEDVVILFPLNSAMGTGNCQIVVPFHAVPELIAELNRMIAGPLGLLILENEK